MNRNAKWIICPQQIVPMGKVEASPEFRREFELDALPQSALLQISGMGFFDARINDRPVTGRLLTPPFTA